MNRKYIVALSVCMISNSWGMDTETLKQDLLTHFRLSEQEMLIVQTSVYPKEMVSAVAAVRKHIAEDMALLEQRGLLTVKQLSGIIKERISSGVTQAIDKYNLNLLYTMLYGDIDAIALPVEQINSVWIMKGCTEIYVLHGQQESRKLSHYIEKAPKSWECEFSNKDVIEMPSSGSYESINDEKDDVKCGAKDKSLWICSKGILITYRPKKKDIAKYLIKNAQETEKSQGNSSSAKKQKVDEYE